MTTVDPIPPVNGLSNEMIGCEITVKFRLLLAAPLTVIRTGPLVAPAGTGTTMLVSVQEEDAAGRPLKVIAPGVAPKLVPVMVMESPIAPELADRLVIDGVSRKVAVLLPTPFMVTTTSAFPAGTFGGTETAMAVSLKVIGVTLIPPMVMGLKFHAVPKPLPLMVRLVPVDPDAGLRLLMVGETK